jgi:replicative DNA helicase
MSITRLKDINIYETFMIERADRIDLENKLLNGMLISKDLFLSVYNFNPSIEDLLHNSMNKDIYSSIIECYAEKGYPKQTDVLNELIIKNKSGDVKTHFSKNISIVEPTFDISIMHRLLDDSIEVRVRESIKTLGKQKITGLDFAESLRDQIDNIILNKYENYKKDFRTNEQKVIELLNSISQIKTGKGSDYIPTGFKSIDDAIIGLPKSHLSTIASRPGVGKTSFMLQLKRNLVSTGYKPLIISIEMTSEQLLVKDLSAYSKIDSRKIEGGKIIDSELKILSQASKIIYEDNFIIEDDHSWTVEKIKSTARRHIIKNKIDCVFIDYLTLIKPSTKNERYDLVIGDITNSLREFAKETGLPIIILSQLNRDCERRTDKTPLLSDLKESGSIEQDSKTVLFLFRPDYYNINAKELHKWKQIDNCPVKNHEYAEVIIAKARSGQTGIVPVRYAREIHLFEDLLRVEPNNYDSKTLTSRKDKNKIHKLESKFC